MISFTVGNCDIKTGDIYYDKANNHLLIIRNLYMHLEGVNFFTVWYDSSETFGHIPETYLTNNYIKIGEL